MIQLEPRLLMSIGYTPAQIRHAYGLDLTTLTGAGQTIAIIDAGDAPNLSQDLSTFDAQFGLSPTTLSTVNQFGGAPGGDSIDGLLGWSVESSLDVEWAHAMAPGAKILWVEALSASPDDLLTAVNYAATHGANVVSMSFGGPENASFRNYDSILAHHVGFVASSGDGGPGVLYPSSSPEVLAVGGTTLRLQGSGNILSESSWNGSGGGISSIYPGRSVPDVAFDADPATGVQIYCTSPNIFANPGWLKVGGTSLGAPCWAGIIACADQSTGFTLTNLPVWVSGLPSFDFNYIGGLTGRGTPRANLIADIADAVFVSSEYQFNLLRNPDGGGFAYWMGELQSGRMTRAQVDAGISHSLEADIVQVELLYNWLLHRAPDEMGLSYWVGVLERSGLDSVVAGITHSQEYLHGG